MIHWMSNEVSNELDALSCQAVNVIGCEVHDEELKGHLIYHVGVNEDLEEEFVQQIDLGDCTGCSDEEINRRFVGAFGQFVEDYKRFDMAYEGTVEDLDRAVDAMKESLKLPYNNSVNMAEYETSYRLVA